jgi:hypothetical protein
MHSTHPCGQQAARRFEELFCEGPGLRQPLAEPMLEHIATLPGGQVISEDCFLEGWGIKL